MIHVSETDLSFDDLAILETRRDTDWYPGNKSVRGNCDCTDNLYVFPKDEKADTPKSA